MQVGLLCQKCLHAVRSSVCCKDVLWIWGMLIARLMDLVSRSCRLAYFYFFSSCFPFWQSTFGGPAFSDLQVCTLVHRMCPWSDCCGLLRVTSKAVTPDCAVIVHIVEYMSASHAFLYLLQQQSVPDLVSVMLSVVKVKNLAV